MKGGLPIQAHKTFFGRTMKVDGVTSTPWLQVEFLYRKHIERHPYGSTTAEETIVDCDPVRFTLMTKQVTYEELEKIFKDNLPDIDIDEELTLLGEKAIEASGLSYS